MTKVIDFNEKAHPLRCPKCEFNMPSEAHLKNHPCDLMKIIGARAAKAFNKKGNLRFWFWFRHDFLANFPVPWGIKMIGAICLHAAFTHHFHYSLGESLASGIGLGFFIGNMHERLTR